MPRMQANSLTIGGNGSQFYFTDFDVVGQNEDGNYSTINWRSYFHFNRADAQLDNGYTDVAGRRWTNGGRIYNYAGNFSTRDLHLASGQFNVGHDGNGNLSIYVAGGVTAYQSGRSEAGAWYGIPGLYQFAAPTHVEFNTVTDTGFNFRVVTNRVVNNIAVSINGGGWIYHDGNTTDRTMWFGNMRSDTYYEIRISLRRASSGNWQEHGNWGVTTGKQNKFFDIGDF